MKPYKTNYLPDFCSVKLLFMGIISGILLALILTLGAPRHTADLIQIFSLKAFFIQWVILPCYFLLCLSKQKLQQLSHMKASFALLGIVLFFTFWVSYITLDLRLVNPLEQPTFILINLIIASIVCILIMRYLFIEYQQREQLSSKMKAQFQALQSRIRPHFLFNSMNTVASLTRKDPILAESLIEDLADLFRASLAEVNQLSTLGDELTLSKGYLRIEQQRLGKRLTVLWDLKEMPKQTPTPHLILQPLLENAVYHGIEPLSRQGRIIISGRITGEMVNLSVRNTKPEKPSKKQTKGNQMALNNIQRRLENAYPNQSKLITSEVDGEYQVRISFPTQPTNL